MHKVCFLPMQSSPPDGNDQTLESLSKCIAKHCDGVLVDLPSAQHEVTLRSYSQRFLNVVDYANIAFGKKQDWDELNTAVHKITGLSKVIKGLSRPNQMRIEQTLRDILPPVNIQEALVEVGRKASNVDSETSQAQRTIKVTVQPDGKFQVEDLSNSSATIRSDSHKSRLEAALVSLSDLESAVHTLHEEIAMKEDPTTRDYASVLVAKECYLLWREAHKFAPASFNSSTADSHPFSKFIREIFKILRVGGEPKSALNSLSKIEKMGSLHFEVHF